MSPIKEPHFFMCKSPQNVRRYSMRRISDEKSYLKLFANGLARRICGEASTLYLWDAETPNLIKHSVKDPFVIILLRNPIDRSFSHYLMDVRNGMQSQLFYKALIQDFNKSEKGWGISHLYIELGMYYHQVRRYIKTFGADRVLIIQFDDLVEEPNATLNKVFKFIQVDPIHLSVSNQLKVFNPYAIYRNRIFQWVDTNDAIHKMFKLKLSPRLIQLIRWKIMLRVSPKPKMDTRAREFLASIYEQDVAQLKGIVSNIRWNDF